MIVAKPSLKPEEQKDSFDDYEQNRDNLLRLYPDLSILPIEILRNPQGQNILTVYWTNFFGCVMPITDWVNITIADESVASKKSPKDKDFVYYMIKQDDLIDIIGKKCRVAVAPTFHYIIKITDDKKLTEEILQKSTLLPPEV